MPENQKSNKKEDLRITIPWMKLEVTNPSPRSILIVVILAFCFCFGIFMFSMKKVIGENPSPKQIKTSNPDSGFHITDLKTHKDTSNEIR